MYDPKSIKLIPLVIWITEICVGQEENQYIYDVKIMKPFKIEFGQNRLKP